MGKGLLNQSVIALGKCLAGFGKPRPDRRPGRSGLIRVLRLSLEPLESRSLLSATGILSGRAFADLNHNAAYDAGEPGTAGRIVFLDANGNGRCDTGEQSTTTGADGAYAFTDLPPGDYNVAEVQQPGWTQTGPVSEGLYYAYDSTGHFIYSIDSAGQIKQLKTLSSSVSISGLAYDTLDRVMYASGVGDELWTVDLTTGAVTSLGVLPASIHGGLCYSPLDDRLYSVTSAWHELVRIDPARLSADIVSRSPTGYSARGLAYNPLDQRIYCCSNSPSGSYSYDALDFSGPTTHAAPADSPNYGLAHNGTSLVIGPGTSSTGRTLFSYDPVTGSTTPLFPPGLLDGRSLDALEFVPARSGRRVVALADGGMIAGLDFGNYQIPTAIIGSVWNDPDGDKIHDTDDRPMAGWTVYLDANGNGQRDAGELSTITDARGNFAFRNPSTISGNVAVVKPTGWQFAASSNAPSLECTSSTWEGFSGDGRTFYARTNADGRFVTFYSSSTNLVRGDTNQVYDVFVFDRVTSTVERVSVSSDGSEANGSSRTPSITEDGRYIAFVSSASNLVPNDTNGCDDIFVHDRLTGTTERVSVSSTGQEANSASSYYPTISGDGRLVAFASRASNLAPDSNGSYEDVFVFDRQDRTTRCISLNAGGNSGNSFSWRPVISGDGTSVAFVSDASDLVPDDTNAKSDIFVFEFRTGAVERASFAFDGSQSTRDTDYPSISRDGRHVTFDDSYSVFAYDRQTHLTETIAFGAPIPPGTNTRRSHGSISGDGRYVFYQSRDLMNYRTVSITTLLYDRQTKTKITVTPSRWTNPDIIFYDTSVSTDGRYLAISRNESPSGDCFVAPNPFLWNQGVYPVAIGPGDAAGNVDFSVYQLPSDYGDAPDPKYPTLFAQNGARHVVAAGLYLGSGVDAESDGRPNADATGDDLVITPDDEDGVTFTSSLVRGQVATIQVVASAAGKLDAWIDFNADGDWSDSYEQVFTSQALAAGTNALSFVVPAGSAAGQTFARFRFSSAGGLSFDGAAADGEVEDYAVSLTGSGEIRGAVWNDLDADGARDTDEPWLAGHTIYLDTNRNGQLDPGEPSAITDANGAYAFTGLAPITYTVADTESPLSPQTFPTTPAIARASLTSTGGQGTANSWKPVVSADGRYLAFRSDASNIVSGDTNGSADLFLRDLIQGTVERVSLTNGGAQANGASWEAALNADGRFVAFHSAAMNLVTGDTNGKWDVFVRDRVLGTNERVSVSSSGTQANGDSQSAAISADGRYVVFQSLANNLVSGDTNNASDVFVFDRQTRTIRRVSVASDGTQGNGASDTATINADGRYIAFQSASSNLVPGDTNGVIDVFVYDTQTGVTERVSTAADGSQGNAISQRARITPDGLHVVFDSIASNLVAGDTNGNIDVFVVDRQTHFVERVSLGASGAQGNGASVYASLSPDGQYVVYRSVAKNLVPGDTNNCDDIFVYDRQTRATRRVTVAASGTQADGASYWPMISDDARWIAFHSDARNLVAGDTNGVADSFITPNPLVPYPAVHRVAVAVGQVASGYNFGNQQLPADFGDAPDPAYPTLQTHDGAVHFLQAGLCLGSTVDAEPDGQPSPAATGDDANGTADDQDGVVFTSALVPGQIATVQVTASAAGKLDAWIDFDANGSWAEATDKVFASQPLLAGVNSLSFRVPDKAAAAGKTFARFRFSSSGGLSYTGLAADGEVEDYQVAIQPPVFEGDTGSDSFSFGTDGTTHTVTVNGVTKTYDASVISLIRFDGLGGNDQITINGGPDTETATLAEGSGTITGPGYTLSITAIKDITIDAGPGSNQVATVADGPGNDTFTGRKGNSSLQYASGAKVTAIGFATVNAYANSTPSDTGDTAILFDSPTSTDQFSAYGPQGTTPARAKMVYGGGGGVNWAEGFNVVQAHATPGGNDMATYYDSTGNDTFTLDAATRASSMTDGANYRHEGDGFRTVYARALGGVDEAFLSGTAGSDSIVAGLRPSGASANYGYLVASTGLTYAYSFAHLAIDAVKGARDSIQLVDSPDSDLVTGGPASVKLESLAAAGPSKGRWVRVDNISSVHVAAGSGTGRDAASLADSAANDVYWSEPKSSRLSYGTGQYLSITGAADVTATFTVGDRDCAYLYDSSTSAANDTLAAGPGTARMSDAGGTYANTATGFGRLYAWSRSGQDSATLSGSTGNDVLTVIPGAPAIQASAIFKYESGDQSVAFGFRAVEADGGTGGTADIAYLHDSPGDDIGRFSQALQTMETTGDDAHVYARTSGFDQVYGKAYHGGRDRMYFADTAGSDTFYGGPARSYLYYAGGGLVEADAFDEVDVAFTTGDETATLRGSPLVDRLSNTTPNDLRLEDQPAAVYWIYLHGLDTKQDRVTATLQADDTSTISQAAVDYLFTRR